MRNSVTAALGQSDRGWVSRLFHKLRWFVDRNLGVDKNVGQTNALRYTSNTASKPRPRLDRHGASLELGRNPREVPTMHLFTVVLVTIGTACFAQVHAQDVGRQAPRPLDEATSKAWNAIGGIIAWMGPEKTYGQVYYHHSHEAMDLNHTFPGIAFPDFNVRDLKTVIAPQTPFSLHLSNKLIQDEDLSLFVRFDNLKALCLSATPVSDAGLKALAAQKSVTHLNLFATEIGDAGVKELVAMEQLIALDLSDTGVTGEGLKALAPLKHLSELYLLNSSLNESDLKELAALKGLQRLDLRNSTLADAGLSQLAVIKTLKVLNVQQTEVTAAGVKAFQAAVPECQVMR